MTREAILTLRHYEPVAADCPRFSPESRRHRLRRGCLRRPGIPPQPEKLEPPPPEALEVQDTPAELPGTASTPGGDTPQPEKPARPRRELIGDHVEVPIIEEKGELQDSQTRPRVYGQRGQELPAAARPKSGKVPRMGTPQGRPRGRGTPAEIKKFSRQVRRR